MRWQEGWTDTEEGATEMAQSSEAGGHKPRAPGIAGGLRQLGEGPDQRLPQGSQEDRPCRHLGLRLASRTVQRDKVLLLKTIQGAGVCFSSPRDLTQADSLPWGGDCPSWPRAERLPAVQDSRC